MTDDGYYLSKTGQLEPCDNGSQRDMHGFIIMDKVNVGNVTLHMFNFALFQIMSVNVVVSHVFKKKNS